MFETPTPNAIEKILNSVVQRYICVTWYYLCNMRRNITITKILTCLCLFLCLIKIENAYNTK